MTHIQNYYDLEEDNNPETNKIKGYRAKKDFWIKEINFKNEEDKLLKLDYLEYIKNKINIYEIIERENRLYISIDYNKKSALLFNELMLKLNNQGFTQEAIIIGNGKYSKLDEIQKLYNVGENIMCKFEIPINNKTLYGSGFFFEIDSELEIPFKKALFTCNHILEEDFLKQNNYLEFKYKENFDNIYIGDSIIYSNKKSNNDLIPELNKRKIFTDKNLDYTCIELLDNDNIMEKLKTFNLFNMKKNFSIKNLKHTDIFILQYPKGNELSFSLGQITIIDDELIKHSASTDGGSSGSPIISRQNIYNVIGVHYGGNEKGNRAHTISIILKDIKDKYKYKCNTLTNNIKIINKHSSYVNNIIILKDGRLCSCSSDQKIIIYNKYYESEITIGDNTNIYYHNQLLNGNIISCCKNSTLKIYELNNNNYKLVQTLKGHNRSVLKVIEINNKLISCAWDKTIKIWEKDDENDNYNCIKTIFICNNDDIRINILKINSYKIVASSNDRKCIKFFSAYDDISEIATINNINCNGWQNSICMIKENILLIGGEYADGIYLIDCQQYKIISSIKQKIYIQSIFKLYNDNILIGCKDENYNYSIIEYKYENNNLIKIKSKENAHSQAILGLAENKDGIIISSSDDRTIKLWN